MLIGIDGNEANIKERVGSNVYAFELIKAIEKFDKQNNFTIYLRQNPLSDLPKSRIGFNYRILPPKYLWTQWRLPLDLYFHKPRPDVFFTPGHYAPRFSPIPTVISILDLSFLHYPDSFQPAVLKQLNSWTKHSALHAQHILTISGATKKDIIRHYGVAPEKTTVTYPGVDDRYREKISSQKIEQTKQKYHIKSKYIFTLGTKQPKKNLSRLVDAFSSVTQSLSNSVTLVIAGKTWHQFTQIENGELRMENVRELDYVQDADIPSLMKGAEAFVLPSLYEGFGIPVAEAMAVGVSVVVSNTSSLPEVVGNAGILVDPESPESIAEGLRNVLSLSREKRVQLIDTGQKQSQQFTWENCAQKTLEVLNAITI